MTGPSERKALSLGERWRREATRDIDDQRLAAALEALPSIRKPMGTYVGFRILAANGKRKHTNTEGTGLPLSLIHK